MSWKGGVLACQSRGEAEDSGRPVEMAVALAVCMLGLATMLSVVECWAAAEPVCVDIPSNMSLCANIGYNKMRLPNLLEHDSLSEAAQQAGSWVPLLNVRCHADTQLFLCSLFSPVCLDRPIFPCRSLCVKVRNGCEARMRAYGYPWPPMFSCDKFPLDNDMCIAPQADQHPLQDDRCRACNQAETYENILDNYCRADFAVRAKFKRIKRLHLTCKKAKVLKGGKPSIFSAKLRRPSLSLESHDICCEEKTKSSREMFLIMGVYRDSRLIPTFIMPWVVKHSKPFKRAVRMFKRLNCTDPKLVSHSVIEKSFNGNVTRGAIALYSITTEKEPKGRRGLKVKVNVPS